MRALCEACGQPQPPDWTPGEQCVHCGQAVRRELRCFWCAKWTLAAKFCRSCGAETVEPRVYGAARMLKDAGTDRFSVPKMLRELDPEQIENFTRIYQRHAALVARHVDELRFLESVLRQSVWSPGLEDELIKRLPWPEETLKAMSDVPRPPDDPLPKARSIAEHSPFGVTQAVAAVARLRLRDLKAHADVVNLLHGSDPALRAEAALALASWRVLWTVGRPRPDVRPLLDELRKSPFPVEAAVGLALLTQQTDDLLRDALASEDPDVAFGAALALGDVDRLRAALKGDELQQAAAGRKLVEMGVIQAVVETVEKSPLEVRTELVEALLRRKGPAPEASATLLEIVESGEDERLRERAARLLCRDLRPEWVLRIAKAARGDRHIYQNLLQAPGLGPSEASELGAFLLREGAFRMHQYGMSDVAKKMPAAFVPAHFAAADEETKPELLRFAEKQLEEGDVEELHRFLLNACFGPHSAKVRAGAWWALHRTYRNRGEYSGRGPLKLETAVLERFFGSVAAFGERLADVVRDPATLKEVGYYEMIAHVLPTADEETVEALRSERLLDALLEGMAGDYWPNTCEAMMRLAARIGATEAWRPRTIAAIRALNRKGSYWYDKELRSLELSAHGVPPESEWPKLPADFAPSRFAAASSEGRAELLKVVDQQLIHNKEMKLGPFLLDVALRHPEFREEALSVYDDRVRERFTLRKKDVERAYGSFADFVALLPGALDDPAWGRILDDLLRNPEPGAVEELLELGEPGAALLRRLSKNPRWARLLPDPDAILADFQKKLARLLAGPGDLESKRREAAALSEAYRGKLKTPI